MNNRELAEVGANFEWNADTSVRSSNSEDIHDERRHRGNAGLACINGDGRAFGLLETHLLRILSANSRLLNVVLFCIARGGKGRKREKSL